jgi:hypothetical protein
MTVYFMGAEKADFVVSNYQDAYPDYNTSYDFNSANARGRLNFAQRTSTLWLETPSFSATEFWTHGNFYLESYSSDDHFVIWYSGTTQYLGIRRVAGTSTAQVRWWNGSSWIVLGTYTFTSQPHLLDVYIKVGSPGEVRVYQNNLPVFHSLTIDTTFGGAVSAFTKVRFPAVSTSIGTNNGYSEIIVADWNTIGSKLVTRAPNAAGTYNEWSGAGFSAVDEIAETNDLIASGTADQRFSFNLADFPALGSGESVQAVKVAAAAVRDASGPQNLNFFTRQGTTDHHATDKTVTTPLSGVSHIFDVNPATGAEWTITDLNAAEFGVRSRT